MINYSHKDLHSITQLTDQNIDDLYALAMKHYKTNKQKNKSRDLLKGQTVINLFFENSTRTLSSFEIAAKRLGADVINIHTQASSIKKGETLIDTVKTLDAMNPDFIIMRHNESGSVPMLSSHIKAHVINGGDGAREHPTQALLDAFTIKQHFGKIEGLKIAICGDILHSRVVRSNITLLNRMGAKIHLVGPKPLVPEYVEKLQVDIFHNFEEGIKSCEVVMMLRMQTERMSAGLIPSTSELFRFFGLSYCKLNNNCKNALVMHPGPMNRMVEIEGSLADDKERSLILTQVEMGVAVRQAVFEMLTVSSH